jgi:hypothetical protein
LTKAYAVVDDLPRYFFMKDGAGELGWYLRLISQFDGPLS